MYDFFVMKCNCCTGSEFQSNDKWLIDPITRRAM